ncbi:aminoglycoside phosphotransferase family protein [Aureibacillus halotolerans]|uniref:Phosphotransferase family enzyme n=1 Tax=Aureibacillus halotolerans TaxID=1508390 RepID=A0A4V3D4M5_9BACI|nr:aminoglycoside phosphotransferase family protein [Aureibacillus halotolerans]TDQ36607.1 phosphotransferase family enzyme [Aureibacillus halotolerans]
MNLSINHIEWIDKTTRLDQLLEQHTSFTTETMNQGTEAEVIKVCAPQESFVLKVWNKVHEPDIQLQYQLLLLLAERGLAVPEPLGWGTNEHGNKVLLTTFDGDAIENLNNASMRAFAHILQSIHQLDVQNIAEVSFPVYEFKAYFFSEAQAYPDLTATLKLLFDHVQIRQDRIIHGDFHMENIIEKNGDFTVIDWTNVQVGDDRYDVAWSTLLMKIYISDSKAATFQSAYWEETETDQDEIDVFEAFACVRWLLLYRLDRVPLRQKTIQNVKRTIARNPFLKEWLISAT